MNLPPPLFRTEGRGSFCAEKAFSGGGVSTEYTIYSHFVPRGFYTLTKCVNNSCNRAAAVIYCPHNIIFHRSMQDLFGDCVRRKLWRIPILGAEGARSQDRISQAKGQSGCTACFLNCLCPIQSCCFAGNFIFLSGGISMSLLSIVQKINMLSETYAVHKCHTKPFHHLFFFLRQLINIFHIT